jgi:hypothetical protein
MSVNDAHIVVRSLTSSSTTRMAARDGMGSSTRYLRLQQHVPVPQQSALQQQSAAQSGHAQPSLQQSQHD